MGYAFPRLPLQLQNLSVLGHLQELLQFGVGTGVPMYNPLINVDRMVRKIECAVCRLFHIEFAVVQSEQSSQAGYPTHPA